MKPVSSELSWATSGGFGKICGLPALEKNIYGVGIGMEVEELRS